MSATTLERIDKARRLLIEGRLTVRQAGAASQNVIAQCRGDSGEIYDLGYHAARKEWRCTCEARGRCSHLRALMLVTTVDR